jgi:hypothetical protein
MARDRAGDGESRPLDYACPRCSAEASVACRGLTTAARRLPAAERTHAARGWAARRCPTCRAWPGEACVTPSGRPATRPHSARWTPA